MMRTFTLFRRRPYRTHVKQIALELSIFFLPALTFFGANQSQF